MTSVSKPRVRQNRHKQGLNQTLEKIFADFRYIGERVVISTRVTILTHDYSINTKIAANSPSCIKSNDIGIFKSVHINDWSFLGAGCIILPGTNIGKYCIIGAGAVVKGNIPDNSIVIGNPAKIIKRTDELTPSELELLKQLYT